MPYIKNKKRMEIYEDNDIHGYPVIYPDKIECAGDLNYAITILVRLYIQSKGENYQAHNDVMGALEGCKLETYRRVTALLEDLKIKENGDV